VPLETPKMWNTKDNWQTETVNPATGTSFQCCQSSNRNAVPVLPI